MTARRRGILMVAMVGAVAGSVAGCDKQRGDDVALAVSEVREIAASQRETLRREASGRAWDALLAGAAGVRRDSSAMEGSHSVSATGTAGDGLRWAIYCLDAWPGAVVLEPPVSARSTPAPEVLVGGRIATALRESDRLVVLRTDSTLWQSLAGGADIVLSFRDTTGLDRRSLLPAGFARMLTSRDWSRCR